MILVLVYRMDGILECTPQQCRRWSKDEKDMLMQYEHLLKISKETFASARQVGFRDIAGEGPPALAQFNSPPAGFAGPIIFGLAAPPAPTTSVPSVSPTTPAAPAPAAVPTDPVPSAVDVRPLETAAPNPGVP